MTGPIPTANAQHGVSVKESVPQGQRRAGTVTGINGKIKVEWDSGRTRYFRHGERSNVELRPPPMKR
jgi:hypothetical protein